MTIKEFRTKHDLSQGELMALIEVSSLQTISLWERGFTPARLTAGFERLRELMKGKYKPGALKSRARARITRNSAESLKRPHVEPKTKPVKAAKRKASKEKKTAARKRRVVKRASRVKPKTEPAKAPASAEDKEAA